MGTGLRVLVYGKNHNHNHFEPILRSQLLTKFTKVWKNFERERGHVNAFRLLFCTEFNSEGPRSAILYLLCKIKYR